MADAISPFTPTMQAQLEQLLQSQVDRSARTTPIHQAAMAMAAHMAPGYAQSAMTAPSGTGSPLPTGSITPTGTSSSGPGVGTTTAVAFIAALLKNGGDNPLMLGLKKLIGAGAGTDPTFGGLIQGNKPFSGGALTGPPPLGGGGGGTGDPTQPGGAQGQTGSIGLPFHSDFGGSGSPPTGPGGQQGNYYDDDSRQSH